MKFTTWMLAEAQFKVKALDHTGKPHTTIIDAEDKQDAIAQTRQGGMFPTEINDHVPSPKDNLDSDQDGTKNSSDSTPTDVPDPTKTNVPDPVKSAEIKRHGARQQAGRNSFKLKGKSSAIGMTDPSKGVGAYKNAVGVGDVVDYIGAKGPGEVPKAAADRVKQSDTIARAKRQKQIQKEREAEERAEQEKLEAEKRKASQGSKTSKKSGGNTKAKDAATTATVTPRAAFGSSAVANRRRRRVRNLANARKPGGGLPFDEAVKQIFKTTTLGEKNDI